MKSVLLDQGLPFGAAELLRERGWDALHVREIGMRDATDREILARAAADGRICVTLDKDFHEALARSQAAHPSVILLRWQNLRADGVAEVIETTLTHYEADLHRGLAITVSARATRVRTLPLGPLRAPGEQIMPVRLRAVQCGMVWLSGIQAKTRSWRRGAAVPATF